MASGAGQVTPAARMAEAGTESKQCSAGEPGVLEMGLMAIRLSGHISWKTFDFSYFLDSISFLDIFGVVRIRREESLLARRNCAELLSLSNAFVTRSHPQRTASSW